MATGVPKTSAEIVNAIVKLEAKRKVEDLKVKAIDEQIKVLEDHLEQNFKDEDINGLTTKFAKAEVKYDPVPNVTDWDALWAYIKRTGSTDLVQKRPSVTAFRARWDAKKAVPGVDVFRKRVVKITALTK
jgi:hypothetical protein